MRLEYLEPVMSWEFERRLRELMDEVAALYRSALTLPKRVGFLTPQGYLYPPADAFVRGDEVVAVFEIPGASKETINLTLRENEVELEAQLSQTILEEASGYAGLKGVKGYKRTLRLPRSIEAEKAKATYRDGVLIVRVPIQTVRGVRVRVE